MARIEKKDRGANVKCGYYSIEAKCGSGSNSCRRRRTRSMVRRRAQLPKSWNSENSREQASARVKNKYGPCYLDDFEHEFGSIYLESLNNSIQLK